MTEVAINITSNGQSEAKAALDSVTTGMAQVTQEHNKMASKFGNKVEHIGLKLFAGEALRASGLGRETNEVIRLMSMSMNTLQASAAAVAAPITVLIGVVAAGIAIFMQMKKAAEEKRKALDELRKTTQDQIKATDENLRSISAFMGAVKQVPPEILKWRDAEENLRKVQIQRMIEADRQLVRSTVEVMNATRERMGVLKETIGEIERTISSLQSSGVDSTVIMAQQGRLAELRREYQKLGDEQVASKAKLEGLFVEIKRLTDGQTQSLKEQTDEWNKNKKAAEEAAKKQVEASQEEAAADTARYQNWAKLHAQTLEENAKLSKEYYQEYDNLGKGAARSVGQAFGDSFVQMAFHGGSFIDNMLSAFNRLTEQIIADIIRIQVQWMIMSSMTGGAGGGFSSFFMAEGGSMLVDRPTLFVAGEAGPEVATFTPLSKMGGGASIGAPQNSGGGGGSSIYIDKVETNVHGVNNPQQIADQVGRDIINRIRGMGELNFVGG